MSGFVLEVIANNSPDGQAMGMKVHERAKTPDLDELQKTVGGYIEALFTIASPDKKRKNIMLTGYVNEEGMLIPLPLSWSFCGKKFAGSMVALALDYSTGESVLLTKDEVLLLQGNIKPLSS